MAACTARAGVKLLRVEDVTGLKSVVAQAARKHANDGEYLSELAAWSARSIRRCSRLQYAGPRSGGGAAWPTVRSHGAGPAAGVSGGGEKEQCGDGGEK